MQLEIDESVDELDEMTSWLYYSRWISKEAKKEN